MAEQEEKKASKEGSSHSVPALNKFMHPRNIYRTPPSFKQLASLYPNFRQFCTFDVSSKVHLDFSNPQALAELAIALLHKDFGLTVHLPSTHLVPTIPLRLNYLLWLQDVVNLWADRRKPDKFDLQQALLLQQAQKQEFLNQQQKENCEAMSQKAKDDSYYRSPVIGFDIGCGASCVYGLLGVKQCGFHMLCSDTDQEALSTARLNVSTNGLQQKIFVVEVSFAAKHKDGEVEPMDVDDSCSAEDAKGYLLDFTMCNPPFFSSEQETDSSSKSKKDRPPPNNAYTGRLHETVVEGGEVAFISRMIEESCQIKHKVRVFSTLVGAAADVKLVKQMLAAVSPAHSVVTEFCQGRTMRPVFRSASSYPQLHCCSVTTITPWTWCRDVCLEVVKSKKQISSVKPLLLNWPRTSHLSSQSVLGAWEAIDSWLRLIKLKAKVFKSSKYFVGASLKAYKVTWQNMRQRRRQENKKHAKPGSDCECPCPFFAHAHFD
ncbi:hypothetical protein HAZT_HAZT009039 [Hyalella azteca]|uniref:U6 small nuclear RNA (adenine-(43)-N(6))-methyltransferase n=1 Tax=Hyalella azteca TaxID=294128 RepID=A0A6A0GQQ9_HYAAZ|nr:hypothetical protein HAZT_HAZT009039 [Hyalella azteca]